MGLRQLEKIPPQQRAPEYAHVRTNREFWFPLQNGSTYESCQYPRNESEGSFVVGKCEQESSVRSSVRTSTSREPGSRLWLASSCCVAVAFFRARRQSPSKNSRKRMAEPVRDRRPHLLQRSRLISPRSQPLPTSLRQNQKKKRKSADRL